jgi:hypothetical protein
MWWRICSHHCDYPCVWMCTVMENFSLKMHAWHRMREKWRFAVTACQWACVRQNQLSQLLDVSVLMFDCASASFWKVRFVRSWSQCHGRKFERIRTRVNTTEKEKKWIKLFANFKEMTQKKTKPPSFSLVFLNYCMSTSSKLKKFKRNASRISIELSMDSKRSPGPSVGQMCDSSSQRHV